jgi:hypothetical protein
LYSTERCLAFTHLCTLIVKRVNSRALSYGVQCNVLPEGGKEDGKMGREKKEKRKEHRCHKMSKNERETNGQRLSEEALSGGREWREAHPKATRHEGERVREERLSRLRARMVHDVAQHSAASEWSEQAATLQQSVPPVEGRCAHEARSVGACTTVQEVRSSWSVTRRAGPTVAPACFPLDRERTRASSGRSPHAHECNGPAPTCMRCWRSA